MLFLTPTPNKNRKTNNLLPLENNQYETRPGFFQVLSDPVLRAVGWGEACAVQQTDGDNTVNRIWHGSLVEPVTVPIEGTFTGTLFQSLTTLGNRENRLYLSNGLGLYYLHHYQERGGEVTGMTIKPETLTLLIGAKGQLTGETVPKWAVNQTMNWSSADASIASVDDRGLVTGVSEDTVAITVQSEEGNNTASCTVTVTPFIEVTAVMLDEESIELELPQTITRQLTATIEPDNATNPNVLWRSYDEEIATVDEYGKVTGVTEGETTVVVMSENGGLTALSAVTVIEHTEITGVTVEPKILELIVSETGQLTATVEPEDASNTDVSWLSDDTDIATVSSSGKVTAVAVGTVFITVTTDEGSFADKCEVTVTEEGDNEQV